LCGEFLLSFFNIENIVELLLELVKLGARIMSEPLLSRKMADGIYIPAGLLVFGTLIVKREWTIYAVLLALTLGLLKFWRIQPAKVLKPDQFQEFELKEKTVISHNVAIYRFNLPTPRSVLGLPIGQHISIGAAIPQPDGSTKEVVRSYTPISGDHQPGYFDLLIKSYPTGNISKHMAGLAVGQTIRVKGPKGAFVYTPNMVRHFGMIAGGTGITPMLQVIRAIIRGRKAGDRTEVDLIFANVTQQDILLKEDLDDLAASDPGVRVHYVLDKPPEGWTGGVGYVTADMITKWLPAPAPDVKILLCGPPPMISGLKKATEALGYKKARPVSKLEDQVFAF
jgi:cytochrome-b5 reductase